MKDLRCESCGRTCEVQTKVIQKRDTLLVCLCCLALLIGAGVPYTRPRLRRELAIGAAKRLDAARKVKEIA